LIANRLNRGKTLNTIYREDSPVSFHTPSKKTREGVEKNPAHPAPFFIHGGFNPAPNPAHFSFKWVATKKMHP
jgi:hypothetical protein